MSQDKWLSFSNLLNRKSLAEIIIPAAFLISVSLIIVITNLDLILQKHFFVQDKGWIYEENILWNLLYDYGAFPGLVLGFGAAAVFLLSFYNLRFRLYRKRALFLILVLFFGGWFLIHVFKEGIGPVFQDGMDRPRPRHVEVFEGDREYLPLFIRGEDGSGKSFPSGHAAIAFYLISPFFVLRDQNRNLACVFLIGGTAYGLFMGVARMVQGGHFLSDVIWSGGFVYLSCWFFYHLLDLEKEARHSV